MKVKLVYNPIMMMKQQNSIVLVASALLLVCMCIHHANSKPLTEQQESPSSSFVATGAEVEFESGLDLLRRITRQADPATGIGNSELLRA